MLIHIVASASACPQHSFGVPAVTAFALVCLAVILIFVTVLMHTLLHQHKPVLNIALGCLLMASFGGPG